jgi:hypothetical protein
MAPFVAQEIDSSLGSRDLPLLQLMSGCAARSLAIGPNAVTFVRILIGLATLRITLLEEIR